MNTLSFLFGFRDQVTRKQYAMWGFGLAILKYAIDAAVVWFSYGKVWSLLGYLSPLISVRENELGSNPDAVLWAMALYSIPFAWVGLSMTIRRAADAEYSPWLGLFFLIPGLNYLVIAMLCFLPSKGTWSINDEENVALISPDGLELVPLKQAVLAIFLGISLTLSMIATSVYVLGDYGWSLFVGTPFIVGAVAGFLVNRRGRASVTATVGVASLSIVLSGLATLLFALEGAICIAMAAVPALGAAIVGSFVGRFIAGSNLNRPNKKGTAQLIVVVCTIPFLAGAESMFEKPHVLREVVTTVDIDAPPDVVWNYVVNFSELAPPNELLFQTGIAYPIRARLEGEGVGAVRYCEFSTGSFVEPITRWEPGKRLSFDVESQPIPMHEWSPYSKVHPPHLDGYFRSKKGEFRFVELANGKTRLEGSTWYELEIAPRAYWSFLADAVIHDIHTRVLEHVRSDAERAFQRPKT